MPNTIADNLQRLVDAKTAIASAITAKGGTVTAGDGFEAFPADIATITSGGGGGDADAGKPVKFIDYDGTIVHSYTASEFAALTAMPSNPTHEGLTAQGWNWSLSDAKAYVAKYGILDIGQMYITDDGRTRLYVWMQEGRLSPVLKLYLNANSELDIDWGDGSAHSTFTSTSAGYKSERHNYASAGAYVVSIGVTSGSFIFRSSTTNVSTLFTAGKANPNSVDIGYLNSIKKVEISDSVTSIDANAFYNCYSLSQVTIPDSVTSIDANAFYNCRSLSQVTIPDSVTSMGTSAFSSCYSLGYIRFKSNTPPTVTNSNAFSNIPTDCIIYVPSAALSAYKSATNYPSSSTYTYVGY
jgi:hypothetical protein